MSLLDSKYACLKLNVLLIYPFLFYGVPIIISPKVLLTQQEVLVYFHWKIKSPGVPVKIQKKVYGTFKTYFCPIESNISVQSLCRFFCKIKSIFHHISFGEGITNDIL